MRLNPFKTGARRAAGILVCGILLAPILCAQTSSSSSSSSSTPEEEEQPRFLRRFSVGLRASIFTLNLLNSATVTSTPNSETVIAQTNTPAYQRLGGGVTLEYAATRRILVSVDLLYHYFAYSAETDTGVSLPDGTTQNTSSIENTHAGYFDLPFIVRYSTLPAKVASARVFIGLGGSLRRVNDIHTTTTTLNADSTTTISYVPRTPAHPTAYGAVATAGFRVKDEFGIKITPEVRYIRWLTNLFDGWPAQQKKNELQVVIGLTF